MRIIVGLGNPGKIYAHNRHNIGFMVLDALSKMKNIAFRKSFKLKARIATTSIARQEIMLVKPLTYMNNSGACVRKIIDTYAPDFSNVLIVYDDIDLALGKVRFRRKGQSAGHRGMNSIIEELETNAISRLRIGVGRPSQPTADMAEYVLSDFHKQEYGTVEDVIKKSAHCCFDWIEKNPEYIMQKYNA